MSVRSRRWPLDGNFARVRAGLAPALLFATSAWAAGGSGWPIFRQPSAPRPSSLTATAGIEGDLSGALVNPASLCVLRGGKLETFGERGVGQDGLGGLLAAVPLAGGSGGVLAAGALYDTAGSMDLSWFDPVTKVEQKKTVSAQRDMVGLLSYARPLGRRFGVGATLKGGSSRIAEAMESTAWATDAGVLWRVFTAQRGSAGSWWQETIQDQLTVGASVRNLGKAGAFLKEDARLPTLGTLGVAYARRSKSWAVTAGVAGDYLLPESRWEGGAALEAGTPAVGVLAGYRRAGPDGFWTLGGTVRLGRLEAAYAWQPSKFLVDAHRVSLAWQFGRRL